MRNLFGRIATPLALALGMSTAAHADALSTPALSGPLAANANPTSFDLDELGKIYVTGAVTGLALYQTNHSAIPKDNETLADFSNAQVFIQKTDGLVQFYAQIGGYSLPDLGAAYIRASTQTANSFGVLPVAYLKIVPSDSFNIEAGRLPTLVGAEYTFTFENLNIERGLLWNQEPAISQGVQANFTKGPLTISASLNDGFFSGRYNWLSGSVAYTISPSDTVSFIGAGNLGHTYYGYPANGPSTGYANPITQNNEQIYNLTWTHTSGPWTITPYVQYTSVPKLGFLPSASTIGGAVLANYAFNANWSLGGRFEYISSSSNSYLELYGPGSKALSVTITPTYQYKIFFARAEVSYVDLGHAPAGFEFGVNANKAEQFRGLFETGIMF
jgi:hypothetical protein